jgi:hypothetical protein
MKPSSWEKLTYFAIIIAVVTLAGIFASGCGSKAPQIPAPAAIVVTTDADLRFALMRAHDVLDLTADTVIAAKRFEEKLIATPDAPTSITALHGKFVAGANDVLAQIRKVAVDIDSKAVTSWASVQARIKPIVDQINALLAITTTPGLSWKDALIGAFNILAPLLAPGVPRLEPVQ